MAPEDRSEVSPEFQVELDLYAARRFGPRSEKYDALMAEFLSAPAPVELPDLDGNYHASLEILRGSAEGQAIHEALFGQHADEEDIRKTRRDTTVDEVRRVLAEHVVEDSNGFYSREVEIETDVLRDVLALLEASAEDLLDSDAGLALANAAWNEGARDWKRYANGAQPAPKPFSPYSIPLLKRINARKLEPQRVFDTADVPGTASFYGDLTDETTAKVARIADRLPLSIEGFQYIFDRMDEFSSGNGSEQGQEFFGRGGVLYGTRSDGMGSADNVWVIPGRNGDLRALWTFYDHDEAMAHYHPDNPESFGLQQNVYGGIPSDFLDLIQDRDLETYELKLIRDPENSYPPIYRATVALLLEDGVWRGLPGYLETSLTLDTDGGVGYIFDEDWYGEED